MRTATEIRQRINELQDANEALIKAARDANQERLSDEDTRTFDANDEKIDELQADLRRAEKHEQRKAHLSARREEPIRPEVPTEEREGNEPEVRTGETRETKAPWKAFGEFLHAVRFNPSDPRLVEQRELSAGVDASGGFMIPEQYGREILEIPDTESIFRPRATVIPAGESPDATLNMPALDQTGAGQNIYGGVDLAWIAEGAAKPETDAKVREVSLTPHELAGTIVVTDKLLRNWQGAGNLIERLFRGAMAAAEDDAFHDGDGVSKPEGVINSAATVDVNRATANQVSLADISAMYARLLRRGGRPVWIYSPTVLPQLMAMEDTGGSRIWLPSAREGMPNTLFGLGAFENPGAPALGTRGDIILVDLNYYLIKDGFGPFVAASEHVLFRSNKTVVKAFTNVDGKSWLNAPLTISGTTYSPFVVLDVPVV